jgi:hypothetical protein
MPVIQVDMFSGRTTEMKRQLVKALTERVRRGDRRQAAERSGHPARRGKA